MARRLSRLSVLSARPIFRRHAVGVAGKGQLDGLGHGCGNHAGRGREDGGGDA
nr:MAG TPA: hypothetical protein [Caudoviricetes sp.]DAP22133.1 MAG TPA: hypothetical protein [Caudoviricetes sp.]